MPQNTPPIERQPEMPFSIRNEDEEAKIEQIARALQTIRALFPLESRIILSKIDRGIEFDGHTDEKRAFMKAHRDVFERAKNLVIDHTINPRTADELQAAAIDLAHCGWYLGLCAERPEDIAMDVLSKDIAPELVPVMKSARSRGNSKKSGETRKRKADEREEVLVRVCTEIQSKSCKLSNRELAEKARDQWPDSKPLSIKTVERKISKLRRERILPS